MNDEPDYIETWEELERRAGRTIYQKERHMMKAAGIIFKRIKGRPPRRHRVIFTYWTLYLRFMMKNN